MYRTISIAELMAGGVAVAPHEAVAIAQLLVEPDAAAQELRPPFAAPSPDNILLTADGGVACAACAALPAVSELAILIQRLLPRGAQPVPGGLRFAIGRALLEVNAPPFDSTYEFSRTLARFERGDRRETVRALFARANRTLTPVPHPVRPGADQRINAPAAAVLRRQLREADQQRFELQSAVASAAAASPPGGWPIASLPVAACLVAGLLLIAAGRLMDSGRGTPAAARQAVTTAVTPSQASPSPAEPGPMAPSIGGLDAPKPQLARAGAARPSARAPRTAPPAAPTIADAGPVDTPDVGPVRTLDDPGPIFSPAFDSKGTAIFYHSGMSGDPENALMAAEMGPSSADAPGSDLRVMTIVDDGAKNYHVQPSPDGRLIAFDSDRDGERGVYVANRDGSGVRRVSGEGFAAVPSWSPDGLQLAVVRGEAANPNVWNLWLLTLATEEMRPLTGFRYGQTWGASWFPDGRRIAYTHEDRLTVLDLVDGDARVYRSPLEGRLVRTAAVSPDGNRVMFQVYRDGAWLLDVRDGSMRRVLADPTAEEFAWSPDGRRVAFHSRRKGGWGIWFMAASQ